MSQNHRPETSLSELTWSHFRELVGHCFYLIEWWHKLNAIYKHQDLISQISQILAEVEGLIQRYPILLNGSRWHGYQWEMTGWKVRWAVFSLFDPSWLGRINIVGGFIYILIFF